MNERKMTDRFDAANNPIAEKGHVYAYTNSLFASTALKCRGMVDKTQLKFWANHYHTTGDASNAPAGLIVFTTHYLGDQLDPNVKHEGVVAVWNAALNDFEK